MGSCAFFVRLSETQFTKACKMMAKKETPANSVDWSSIRLSSSNKPNIHEAGEKRLSHFATAPQFLPKFGFFLWQQRIKKKQMLFVCFERKQEVLRKIFHVCFSAFSGDLRELQEALKAGQVRMRPCKQFCVVCQQILIN